MTKNISTFTVVKIKNDFFLTKFFEVFFKKITRSVSFYQAAESKPREWRKPLDGGVNPRNKWSFDVNDHLIPNDINFLLYLIKLVNLPLSLSGNFAVPEANCLSIYAILSARVRIV